MKIRQARKILRRYWTYRAGTWKSARKRLSKVPPWRAVFTLIDCLEAGYKVSIPTVGSPLIVEDLEVSMKCVEFDAKLINIKQEKANG